MDSIHSLPYSALESDKGGIISFLDILGSIAISAIFLMICYFVGIFALVIVAIIPKTVRHQTITTNDVKDDYSYYCE